MAGIIGQNGGPKFYAVRVVIWWSDGSATQRDYVRGLKRLSQQDFDSFAVGDMIQLINQGFDTPFGSPTHRLGITRVTVEEIDRVTVVENRKYKHTTH